MMIKSRMKKGSVCWSFISATLIGLGFIDDGGKTWSLRTFYQAIIEFKLKKKINVGLNMIKDKTDQSDIVNDKTGLCTFISNRK